MRIARFELAEGASRSVDPLAGARRLRSCQLARGRGHSGWRHGRRAQHDQSGAAAGTPQKGGTLVVAFNADPETFDPHIRPRCSPHEPSRWSTTTLLERDYDGSYKPGLATKLGRRPRRHGVHLPPASSGVKFHSGKAFSSADVKYTFERWLSIPTSPTSFGIKPIDNIDAPDPQTVVSRSSSRTTSFSTRWPARTP